VRKDRAVVEYGSSADLEHDRPLRLAIDRQFDAIRAR
jgi:hypothetical protein